MVALTVASVRATLPARGTTSSWVGGPMKQSVRPVVDLRLPGSGPDGSQRVLRDVLGVLRAHLGMEVAFISRVDESRRVVEQVDADPWFSPLSVGDSDSRDDSYCGRVLSGRAPGFILDASLEPGVADLEATFAMPIGSHLSVPVRTSDGATYGTLCCFSRRVHPELRPTDLATVQMFAAIVGKHLEPIVERRRTRTLAQEQISQVLDDGTLAMALQPIVDLTTDRVCGYEALARFPGGNGWSPERWFDLANQVGMGPTLESAAVHAALRLLPRLPPATTLAINVSAAALLASSSIVPLFAGPYGPRLVLELTEHDQITDQQTVDGLLARVRAAGVRVAIDDAGTGYAGLERILALHPEVLKLDRSLVDGVARHPGRTAMCEAMVRFTRRTGTRLIAEGVETDEDLTMLRWLGVTHAQGYLLGRPTIWE